MFPIFSSATFSICHWCSWHVKLGPLHVFLVWPYFICTKDNRNQLSVVVLWLIAESFRVQKVLLLTGKKNMLFLYKKWECLRQVIVEACSLFRTFSLPSAEMPCGALHFPTKIRLTEYLLFHSGFSFQGPNCHHRGEKKVEK